MILTYITPFKEFETLPHVETEMRCWYIAKFRNSVGSGVEDLSIDQST